MRGKIYNIIRVSGAENSSSLSGVYDSIMLVVIVVSLIPLAFKSENEVFRIIDLVTAGIFIIDYLLRWITADYKFGKKGIGSFLKYPFTPFAIIDLLSILPVFTALSAGFELLRLARLARLFRVIRTLRIFRAFKGLRYFKSLAVITEVLKKQKSALIAVGTLAVAYILVSALLMFNVEPESFPHFFDAVYWSTISLTTVGYGDISPITIIGKTVTIISSLFGIAIVALPAGIITAGYMSEISEKASISKTDGMQDSGEEV